jgi:hypothetical protein
MSITFENDFKKVMKKVNIDLTDEQLQFIMSELTNTYVISKKKGTRKKSSTNTTGKKKEICGYALFSKIEMKRLKEEGRRGTMARVAEAWRKLTPEQKEEWKKKTESDLTTPSTIVNNPSLESQLSNGCDEVIEMESNDNELDKIIELCSNDHHYMITEMDDL